MLEKLPMDFVRKIYNLLVNGNEDVNFYCMCVHNQNREAATNNPVKFALNLLKINIVCRLPFTNKNFFSKALGTCYLSEFFVRPSICELASGMLDNTHLVADIFGCIFTTIKSRTEIFGIIENELGIKGFAEYREKLDNPDVPISDIYEKISNRFSTSVDCKVELAIMERYLLSNKYTTRLIDIAFCNNLKVTAIARTSYPREFVESLLKKYDISVHNLLVTSECKIDINDILENPRYTGVLSCDYNKFIKKFMKYGCKPIYYRNPKDLMERTVHPELDENFKDIYNGICGLRLFSGLGRMSREYELSYLCIAPAVTGFAMKIAKQADNGENVICLCEETSVFAMILKRLTKNYQNITFFEWSPIASSKYKSVDKWLEIINDTPFFNYAYSGAFDALLRYPISQSEDQSLLFLARVMATAWKDKSSDGVNKAIQNLVGNHKSVVIADPIAGKCGSTDFCSILGKVNPDIIYKCFTISNYLGGSNFRHKSLAKIVQGNKPLLWQIDKDEKKWVYPQKLNKKSLNEIYNAIYDFTNDYSNYCLKCNIDREISGNDANNLYDQAIEYINKII